MLPARDSADTAAQSDATATRGGQGQAQPPGKALRRPRSLRRRLAFVAILAFVLALLVVLVGEVFFRAQQYAIGARVCSWLGIESEPVGGWPIHDPDLIYRNRPGWGDHNADGMRDDPTPPKSRFRLLMLGDSVGYYGDSIADTYPGRLESVLNKDPSTVSCDVLNAGTRGYSTYQELSYLRKYGAQFEPDTVGLGFCVNDLHRFLHAFDVVDGEIAATTYQFSRDALRDAAPALLRPSLFLSWLWVKAHAATVHFGWRDGFIFDHRLDVCTAWKDDRWGEMEGHLEEMAALCRDRNTTFFVVAFPYSYQYREDYLAKDRHYVLKPQRRLRAICERLGVPFLDLYPQLSAADFMEDGIHLTKDGRRNSAAAIAAFLRAEKLVPPSGE